jgi:hypothetical protein
VVPARLRGASVGELASGASGLAREAADREIRGLGRGPESSRRLPGPGGGIRSRDRYLRNAVEEPESTSGGHSIRRLASANDGNLIVFEMAESPCRDDLRRGSAICRSPQASVGLPTAKPETGRNRAGLDRGLGTSRSPPKSRRAPAQRSLSDWSPRERQSRRRGTSTKGSRWSPETRRPGSTAAGTSRAEFAPSTRDCPSTSSRLRRSVAPRRFGDEFVWTTAGCASRALGSKNSIREKG